MKHIMQKMKNTQFLKPGSKLDLFLEKRYNSSQFTYGQIFGMLIPLIVDQFFIYFISVLTSSLISASSETSTAAVSLVSPIAMIAMSLFSAISNGGTVIVAQYKGKGDEEQVRRSAAQVIIITFLVATLSCILMIIFARPLIDLFFGSTDQLIRDKATEYMIGFALSLPTFSIFNGIFNVLRGVGDTKICLRLTVVINIVHLVACVIFINFLKLDILGTTLAFNVARMIGCILALYIIFNPKGNFTLRLRDFSRIEFNIQKAIVKMGIPFAVEQIFLNVGFMLCQIYMAHLGQSVIAGNYIASSISNLFYSAGFAVSTLSITVIGQCIGAGEIDTAKRYGKRMIRLGTITMILSLIVLLPVTPLILTLFRPEASTLPLVTQAILIGIIPIPFVWSLSYVTPSILRAAGDANFTSTVALMTMWTMRVGLGYVLAIPCGLGLNGVWISMGAEWAARAIIYWVRYKGTKWLEKKVV